MSRPEAEAFFGTDGLVRIPADRLPDAIGDEGARSFLTGIGLPSTPVSILRVDDRVPAGTIRLADYYLPRTFEQMFSRLPAACGGWRVLGEYVENVFLLDGATGAVHAVGAHPVPAEVLLRPVHRDLHSLVRCVMAVKPVLLRCVDLDDEQEEWCAAHFAEWAGFDEESMADVDLHELTADLIGDLRAIEPDVLAHPVWQDILRDLGHEP